MRRALPALLLLLPLLAGCASPPAAEVRARAGDLVEVDLRAWDERGVEVVNRTGVRAVLGPDVPARLPAGWDAARTEPLPPGVVAALLGSPEGALVGTPLLPAEQAYGNWSAERTIRAPLRDALPLEVDVNASAVRDGRASWAGHEWGVEVLARAGDLARVRLVAAPAAGASLEVPAYWNVHYQLWRSRLVALGPGDLSVEHAPELGRTASVGGVRYVVTQVRDEAVADGNPPHAGQALRFEAALRRIAFAPGTHPLAPDAVIVALDGQRMNLSDLRGKAVLLDFFATWCVTCKQQAPILARAREAYGANLTIVSITIDPTDTPERIAAFRADVERSAQVQFGRALPADWLFAFDPTGQAAKGFTVTILPRGVLLDAEGRIRATSLGLHPWNELRADVDGFLAPENSAR